MDTELRVLWREINATRARPPGKASEDDSRRALYAAALEQSEELARAAAVAGPAARALPLFYSLSQAGRAIAAAHADSLAELRGHGLSFPESGERGLIERIVKPNGNGVIHVVAEATQSPAFDQPATLGALWSSLPDLAEIELDGNASPRALRVDAVPVDPSLLHLQGNVVDTIVSVPGELIGPEAVRGLLASYPSTRRARVKGIEFGLTAPIYQRGEFGVGVMVEWPAASAHDDDRRQVLDEAAPEYHWRGQRWIRPEIGSEEASISPLITWWVVLFALSHITRYAPEAWRRHLDVDRSTLAVPLAACLDAAERAVPRLVLGALAGFDVVLDRRDVL